MSATTTRQVAKFHDMNRVTRRRFLVAHAQRPQAAVTQVLRRDDLRDEALALTTELVDEWAVKRGEHNQKTHAALVRLRDALTGEAEGPVAVPARMIPLTDEALAIKAPGYADAMRTVYIYARGWREIPPHIFDHPTVAERAFCIAAKLRQVTQHTLDGDSTASDALGAFCDRLYEQHPQLADLSEAKTTLRPEDWPALPESLRDPALIALAGPAEGGGAGFGSLTVAQQAYEHLGKLLEGNELNADEWDRCAELQTRMLARRPKLWLERRPVDLEDRVDLLHSLDDADFVDVLAVAVRDGRDAVLRPFKHSTLSKATRRAVVDMVVDGHYGSLMKRKLRDFAGELGVSL